MLSGSKGKYPYDRGKHLKVVVELRAYGDESGTHQDASHCVVSGWIASLRQWRKFDDGWNQVLGKYEVPEFHSSDFFQLSSNLSSSSPYRHWSLDKRALFVEELTNVINGLPNINPVGGAINIRSFLRYSEGARRYFTSAHVTQDGRIVRNSGTPNKPYHAAFTFFLCEALMQAKPKTRVHFVVDQYKQEEKYALQVFNSLKKNPNPPWGKLGSIIFADRRQEPGLQAADLLNHLWYSFLEHGVSGMGKERYDAWQYVKKRREGMRVADEEYFDMALATLTPVQLERLA